jgi:hypothetical protein
LNSGISISVPSTVSGFNNPAYPDITNKERKMTKVADLVHFLKVIKGM